MEKIVIIGLPTCGKTTYCEELAKQYPEHRIFHTDEYIHYGFDDSLYNLMSDVMEHDDSNIIIEGVRGYRLLRKGIQTGLFKPDLVITCDASMPVRLERYARRGGDAKKLMSFDKTLTTIWNDYLSLLKDCDHQPEFRTVKTD